MTDHNFVTYPWSTYGRDPVTLGMVDIQGNELSSGHHIVSLFSGYANTSADETTLLTGVGTAGGLAFFAHPGRYTQTAQWYADHYLAQPHCIGQEIYNQGDRYTGDRVKWDQVLSILMPSRPVWGFSNDDSHDPAHVGKNRTYLLLPSLSAANVRTALEDGQFYATYSTSAAAVPPAFTNIAVDAVAGTVTVRGTGYTQVRWISQGTQVATGETLDLVATPGVAKYVRAELHGSGGIAYSNPFGVVMAGSGPATNLPPVVSISSPANGATVATHFTLTANATDDGTVTNVAFFADGSLLGNDTAAPYSWTWNNASVGSHALTAVATDNNGAATTSAVVSITVTGAVVQGFEFAENFDGMGTGTAVPAGWSFLNQASGSPNDKTLWVIANPIVQTGVTMNPVTPLTRNDAPTANNNNGYNALGASGQTGDRCIASAPTTIASLGIQAPPVTNNTGSAVAAINLSYDIKRFTAGGSADELLGFWLFYSVDNGTTWYNVTALNPTVANVPNTVGITSIVATNIVLSAPWASGGTLLLRWVDDNGIPSPDQIIGLDNVHLTTAAGSATPTPPTVAITSPISNAITDTNFTITVAATDDGTVTNVAFLADGGLLGSDASAPYSFTWNGASAGAHALTVVAWDNDGLVTTSTVVNVTVTLPTPSGISFGATGTGTLTFDSLPAATQWATASVGADKYAYTTGNQVDAAVTALAASAIANTLVSSTAALPSLNGQAVWTSGGGAFIQTCPTGIGATLLRATLVNNSGSDLNAVRVSYQYTVVSLKTEDVPGQHVFYSLTGAAGSWTAIPELSGVTTSTSFDVTVSLSSPWVSGSTFFLMWADDNDTANSPDTYFQIDAFSVSPSGPLPFTVALTSPANGQTFASGTPIAMQAVTSGVTSAIVTGVLFRADSVVVGDDATPPYAFSWANAAAGAHALNAVALLDNGSAVTSATVTVTMNAPVNQPPSITVIAPTNGASTVSLSPSLTVSVSDPESSTLSVAFYGRAVSAASAGPDFSIVAIPDTQNYSTSYPLIFQSQTDWIVTNRQAQNIAYVAGVGDIVNTSSSQAEYLNATNALYRLENPATTGLPDGIPYGTAVGNHDQPTTLYNQYFGVNHFAGRSYYGGNYGSNNDSHYDLFSASGMDFIVLYITMGGGSDSSLMAWGNSVLQTYASRRAIVVSHSILNVTTRPTPSTWTGEGQPIFDALKGNTNLFLMLCGHMHGEGFRREVLPDGRVIDIVLADYQDYPNGGNGNLRVMTFSPSNNQVRVSTYSPYTASSLTGADSQFNLDYAMSGPVAPFVALGTNTGVASGSQTTFNWPSLTTNTTHEWYAVVSDGTNSTTGASVSFTTPGVNPLTVKVDANVYQPFGVGLTNNAWVFLDADPANGSPLRATQRSLGYREVDYKAKMFGGLAFTPVAPVTNAAGVQYDYTAQKTKGTYTVGYWKDKDLPVMIGPDGNAYITDGHHTSAGYLSPVNTQSGDVVPGLHRVVLGHIVTNFYNAAVGPQAVNDAWWTARMAENNAFLYGISGNQLAQPSDPDYAGLQPILPGTLAMPVTPSTLGAQAMTHDIYRGLMWGLADGILKTAMNGTSKIKGFSKTNPATGKDINFVEFFWADFLRNRVVWDDAKSGHALGSGFGDANAISAPLSFFAAVANGTALARSQAYRDQYGRSIYDYTNSAAFSPNTVTWASASLVNGLAVSGDAYNLYLLDDSAISGDIAPSPLSANTLHIDTSTGMTVSNRLVNIRDVAINAGGTLAISWKDASVTNSTLTIPAGTGRVALRGSNTVSGAVTLAAGKLAVDGSLTAASLTVAPGATLEYTPGSSPITVTGNLALNGTLNITGSGFSAGTYTLFTCGSLSGGGLTVGTVSDTSLRYVVSTNVPGQVQLFVLPFHTLTATAGVNGTVTPATSRVTHGFSTSFIIQASSYYHVADVRTNGVSVGGTFGMAAWVYTWENITADGTLAADFAQNLTAGGTPEAWLAEHGLSVGEENTDKDGDGLTARAEYVAGTDPTNVNSVLKVTGTEVDSVAGLSLRWPSVAGRVYDVEHSTNLSDALSFQPLLTDLKATPSTNSCSVPVFPNGAHFFRLKVRLAP